MACCSEFQTECLKVVTIKYLNDFIGNNIKDANGNVKTAAGDDTYCPTYSELTGGRLIPNWSQGSSPFLDVDGIVVTGSYTSNQLVNQKDLQVKYTTLKTLTISRSGSGDLSACGADTTLGYTYNYDRHVKSMNSSSCSSSESTETVSGKCSELTYHTTYGTVTNCTSYHINKNGEFSGSNNQIPSSPARRCDTVYADVTFRGVYKKSNELSICQKKLTGQWSSSRDSRDFTNFTVQGHPSNTTIYSCSMQYVYLTGTATYTDWYHWIDECGTNYYNIKSGVTTTEGCDSKYCNVSGPSSINCSGTANFSFTSGSSSVVCADGYIGYNWDCCNGRKTATKTLTKSFGGKSGSVTWTWICNSCDSCENCPQNHTCSDCANVNSSKWGCSKCAKQLGCDKCLDYLTCDDCPNEKSCDECPDLEKCQETPEGT
jgi:hypothetical protein